jgi:calcineurin-like phosphoesterase family protein
MNIWVISDTHFGQENILKFRDSDGNLIRGSRFSSAAQMNECMLDNWNSVVKPGDRVYHLGDVMMMPKDDFAKLWPKFNGSKRLIVGNHDDIPWLASGGFFKKVQMWRMMPEFGLLLTHVPIHESGLRRGAPDDETAPMLFNVMGHIHHNPAPKGPYRCVCVEQTNYTPVNIEVLAEEAKKYFQHQRQTDRPFLQP